VETFASKTGKADTLEQALGRERLVCLHNCSKQLDIVLTDDAEPECVRIFGATACSAYEKETQVQGGGGRRRWAADEYYG
jgi:hypothetical protein